MEDRQNVSKHRQEMRERVVATAMKAFAANGVKAVRMDDIAQQLSMSKRTLYELFDDKEDLLLAGIRSYRERREREMMECASECHNVIETVLFVCRKKVEDFNHTVPQFYTDIVKCPRVMAMLEKDKTQNQERLISFFERGVQEGYFRSEINFEIVAKLFDAIGLYIMEQQLYCHYSIEQLFHNLVFTSLRGICTQQGIEVLDRSQKGYI